MKQKIRKWICKWCGTEEIIYHKEYGIDVDRIINVECPICICNGHTFKMIEVEIEDE